MKTLTKLYSLCVMCIRHDIVQPLLLVKGTGSGGICTEMKIRTLAVHVVSSRYVVFDSLLSLVPFAFVPLRSRYVMFV
jgi:hypothetical protein